MCFLLFRIDTSFDIILHGNCELFCKIRKISNQIVYFQKYLKNRKYHANVSKNNNK